MTKAMSTQDLRKRDVMDVVVQDFGRSESSIRSMRYVHHSDLQRITPNVFAISAARSKFRN